MRAALNGGAPPSPSPPQPPPAHGVATAAAAAAAAGVAERRRRCSDFLVLCEEGHAAVAACSVRRGHCCFVWADNADAPLPAAAPSAPSSSGARSAGGSSDEDGGPNVPLAAAAALAAACAAGAGIGPLPPGVQVSCLPLFFPPFPFPGFVGDGGAAAAAPPQEWEGPAGASSRARLYQGALVAACSGQASAGALEFVFEDPLSGVIGCAIATLGMQAAAPGGQRLLPSYIVLAFCNGTMQVLLGLEAAATRHALFASTGKSLIAKLGAALSVASPMLMFAGLVVAWHLHVELRTLDLQAGSLPPADPSAGVFAAGPSAGGPETATLGFRPFSGAPHRLERTPVSGEQK